jgi:hypothetical protein
VPGVPDQRAWLFIPDDQRLRVWAALMAEQRRHSLARDPNRVVEFPERQPEPDEGAAQLSLFAPLSAVATETAAISPWQVEPLPDDGLPGGDPRIELALADLPGFAVPADDTQPAGTRRETKDALRLANAAAARDLARRTGLSHAHVNAELNRMAGVRRITEATVGQLDTRLRQAERWLARV